MRLAALFIAATTLVVTTAHAADSAECRGEATVENATGVESVNSVLYSSCMQAGTAKQTALNSWVVAHSCPGDFDAFQRSASDRAHACRLGAVELDASGHPRVNRGTVRRCMAAADLQNVPMKRAVVWADRCGDTFAAVTGSAVASSPTTAQVR